MKDTIKISVDINVNIPDSLQNLIQLINRGVITDSSKNEKPAVDEKPAVKKQVDKKTVAKKQAEEPATKEPKITIEDVRKVLSEKVNDYRDAIKNKLNELGAPSVTKLDPQKYPEMYNFLTSLK